MQETQSSEAMMMMSYRLPSLQASSQGTHKGVKKNLGQQGVGNLTAELLHANEAPSLLQHFERDPKANLFFFIQSKCLQSLVL